LCLCWWSNWVACQQRAFDSLAVSTIQRMMLKIFMSVEWTLCNCLMLKIWTPLNSQIWRILERESFSIQNSLKKSDLSRLPRQQKQSNQRKSTS
jgi:hypothetical protein